ncbi:MAG: response regulator, partial [Nitrosarchaeum sp.]
MISCIVIDDDVNTVRVFSDLLELLGLQVVGQGYAGQDAVLLYQTHHPDITFVDLVMPETDGFYAVEKIMTLDSDAKVVAVTADFTLETEERLKKMNVSAIIYKPF